MSTSKHKDPIFFLDPDRETGQAHRIIDHAVFSETAQAYTTHAGQTLEAMQERYPGLKVGDFDDIMRARESFYRELGVYEIDEETFMDALECLPPLDWVRKGYIESFKLSELITGNIAWIYCRVGSRFFRFYDEVSLSPEGIARRLDKGIQAIAAATAVAAQQA
jgi:hypothetical protein